jgi:hypothetical protein
MWNVPRTFGTVASCCADCDPESGLGCARRSRESVEEKDSMLTLSLHASAVPRSTRNAIRQVLAAQLSFAELAGRVS